MIANCQFAVRFLKSSGFITSTQIVLVNNQSAILNWQLAMC